MAITRRVFISDPRSTLTLPTTATTTTTLTSEALELNERARNLSPTQKHNGGPGCFGGDRETERFRRTVMAAGGRGGVEEDRRVGRNLQLPAK